MPAIPAPNITAIAKVLPTAALHVFMTLIPVSPGALARRHNRLPVKENVGTMPKDWSTPVYCSDPYGIRKKLWNCQPLAGARRPLLVADTGEPPPSPNGGLQLHKD